MRLPHTSRTLWIDAVCINQKDLLERGPQVALMGQIYSRCTANLIHLDNNDTVAGTMLELIQGICQASEEASYHYET